MPASTAAQSQPQTAQQPTTSSTPDLSHNTILADLDVRMPSMKRSASDIAQEAATAHGANVLYHSHSERLLGPDATQPLESWRGRIKKEYYRRTLPWEENGGARILATAGYFDFQQAMRKLMDEGDTLLSQFVANYVDHYNAARRDRGDRFDPSQYPDPSDIADRFLWRIRYKPLATAGDFRANLNAADISAIQQQIASDQAAQLADTLREPYRRLAAAMSKMAEQLRSYDGGRTGSKFGAHTDNIREIIDVLPSINITADPALDNLATMLKGTILRYSNAELKDDEEARLSTAEIAEQIVSSMSAFV